MNQKENKILLGLYNPYPDPNNPTGFIPEMREEIRTIRKCLVPLKKQTDKNTKDILKIKTIGGTISGIFGLALTGLKMWLGRHHQ